MICKQTLANLPLPHPPPPPPPPQQITRHTGITKFVFVVTGRVSLPHVSSYCVTKYGVQAFSDALRREMSPWGILVSIIEPGLFKTALANEERNLQAAQELWDGLSSELKQEYGERKLNRSKMFRQMRNVESRRLYFIFVYAFLGEALPKTGVFFRMGICKA